MDFAVSVFYTLIILRDSNLFHHEVQMSAVWFPCWEGEGEQHLAETLASWWLCLIVPSNIPQLLSLQCGERWYNIREMSQINCSHPGHAQPACKREQLLHCSCEYLQIGVQTQSCWFPFSEGKLENGYGICVQGRKRGKVNTSLLGGKPTIALEWSHKRLCLNLIG